MNARNQDSRRDFIRKTALAAAGACAAPVIVPSYVMGKNAPSNKINIGQIGCGRIARGHDLPETMKNDRARVVAACDVDSKRLREGAEFIERWYAENKGVKNFVSRPIRQPLQHK